MCFMVSTSEFAKEIKGTTTEVKGNRLFFILASIGAVVGALRNRNFSDTEVYYR